MTPDFYKMIADDFKKDDNRRSDVNKKLADMYKGKMKEQIYNRIASEFSKHEQILEIAQRSLPINLVKRVTDKLAVSYKEAPIRELSEQNDNDQQIFDYYTNLIDFNELGTTVDRYLCMHKECLVWPYFNQMNMIPAVKVLRPWEYKIYSLDKQDDEATNVVVIPDKVDGEDVYKVYSDEQIIIIDALGNPQFWMMSQMGNEYGLNPYGKLPFVYVRSEKEKTMTYPDEAFLDMSLFIPILFGDLNYAIKYQSFGMIWGRNVNEELINRSPNAFLNLVAGDIDSQVTPEVGVIKPEVDISESLDTAVKELALWLNSRGLRPSAISSQGETFSSAISKMVDEADASQIVSQNQNIYKKYEKALFDFMLKNGHMIWQKESVKVPKTIFNATNSVITTFKEPKPYLTIAEVIDQQTKLLDASLTSKKQALRAIYPQYKDEKIDEIFAEIEAEKGEERTEQVMPDNPFERV